MSYLQNNPAQSRYPIRQWNNPISIKSPDSIPSIGTFSYQSNGDINDMIYYIGTNKRTGAFVNPHTNGAITVSGTGIFNNDNQYNPIHVTDRNSNTQYFSVSQNNPYIEIDFKSFAPKINRVSYQVGTSSFGISPMRILGSNDLVNWATITDIANASGAVNTWVTPPAFVNSNFYRYYRIMRVIASSILTCKEIQFYGEMPL